MVFNPKENITALNEFKKKNKNIYFKSDLEFLSTHNGIRPGNMHLFIAATGGGKSTLSRSIVVDFLKNNPDKKVFVWLSEETSIEYVAQFDDIYSSLLTNFRSFSEVEKNSGNSNQIAKSFHDIITEKDFDLFIFDNITTSVFYQSLSPKEQSRVTSTIRRVTKHNDIPIIIFAHTGATIRKYSGDIVEANDIRGTKDIVNVSEFVYLIQAIIRGNSIMQILRIDKHRNQTAENKMFILKYQPAFKLFENSNAILFDDYKKQLSIRDKV